MALKPQTRHKQSKGFLLVEALISITILLMVAATTVTLLIMANRAINFNEHSLEASWIAQEGVNHFRGIRDTNWIRFGYDKANCWKMAGATCPGSEITDGNYALTGDIYDIPELQATVTALNLTDGIDSTDEAYQLFYQPDGTVSDTSSAEPSRFYREFSVTINGDYLEAVCTVAWLESGDEKRIALPITLTNFALEE